MYNKHIFTLIFLTLGFQVTFAQEEEEKDLGTETVTVTKAYTPTVSDAFKIKSVPKYSITTNKLTLYFLYRIMS